MYFNVIFVIRMILDDFSIINKSMEGFWIGFGVVSCCADGGLLTKFKKLIFRHGEIEL